MYNVNFAESNINYGNFSLASFENVFYEKSSLSSSNFQENRLKNILFEDCNLSQTTFFKTKLKDIDFSTCNIEGISATITDISGIIINQFQAVDLLHLFGIKIKDTN